MRNLMLLLLAACLAGCGKPSVQTAVERPVAVLPGPGTTPMPKEITPADDGDLIAGKPVEYWVKALKDKDESVRKNAAEKLAGAGEKVKEQAEELGPALIAALQDPNADVRNSAAQALGEAGGDYVDDGVKTLVEALKNKDDKVRFNAADSLGLIGEDAKDAVPDLAAVLKDPKPSVRAKAAWALGHIGNESRGAVPALAEALKDKNPEVRLSVAESLNHMGSAAGPAVSALADALKDASPKVRVQAAQALGWIGRSAQEDSQAESPMPDKERIDKAKALTQSVVKALSEALKDVEVRRTVVADLSALGEAAAPAAPELTLLLKDQDTRTRLQAAQVLANLKDQAPAGVSVLIEILKDGKNEAGLRAEAARAIGFVSPAAKSAVPALLEAMQDKSEEVRLAAEEALKKIDPAEAAKAGVK